MPQCQFLFIMSVHCRKGPKMKVLGKIWKNYRSSRRTEDSGSQKESRRSATGGTHPPQARASPGRAQEWCGPLVHRLASPLRLFNPSDAKTLSTRSEIHKKFRSAATIAYEIRGTEVSILALCPDGELPPEPSPSTPSPSPSPLLTPMMRRE